MFRVTREFEFCFGHRLRDYPGKCRNIHGHNAKVAVTLEFDSLDRLGMVVDFVEIKRVLAGWIEETLDHTLLLQNDDPLVKTLQAAGEKVLPLDVTPTTENPGTMSIGDGAMLPLSGVTCQVVVAPGEAERYCTDQVDRSTGADPLFRSSMKSFFRVAPELPPPP